ncbi:MAG TPA: WYL domain-containing protein [Candidatus Binatia bacterium]|nr:WYL domain-containing protein [Candidatus Binatia bacterium]
MRPRSRPATYRTATRLARIVHGLLSRPHGWSFAAIQDELAISERTLLRYLAACRTELVDAEGRPLLEVVRRGDRRVVRLADAARAADSTSYQALSFYFALSVFQFLDGTILKDGVEDLWRQFYRALPPGQQSRLAHFDRKFYSVPWAVKDYRAYDETLDAILRCLVAQHTMRIDYGGLWLEGHVHEFDPYTLAMYRGGLYLIGRSHHYRRIVWLAVERIRKAERLPAHFDYPPRYSPAKYTEGTFGIVDGPETRVAILLRTKEAADLLSSRRLHPTQRFTRRPDGSTVLTMTVRGTEELKNWILSLGPYVEVLEPESLRRAVAETVAETAALYRRGA